MKCQHCDQGTPHAPHTCGRLDLPPRERGIPGKAVNHWFYFSPCGAAKDEKRKKHYPVYCTTHGS